MSESESEAMWSSASVEGHQEWSRRSQFNDPYCGGLPLRHEEEREGSIMSNLYVKLVIMIFGPWFQWIPTS